VCSPNGKALFPTWEQPPPGSGCLPLPPKHFRCQPTNRLHFIFIMLSRAIPFTRAAATRSLLARPVVGGSRMLPRLFSAAIEDVSTAADAAALSGYSDIDYVISDDAPVIDAVQRFAAYNIGCLVTTDASGRLYEVGELHIARLDEILTCLFFFFRMLTGTHRKSCWCHFRA